MVASATTTSGGKISGLVALTFEAVTAVAVNEPCHVTGDYRVAKADGTKPIVGFCDKANVKRVGGVYPSLENPGTVTVEARGVAVRTLVSGGAVAVGIKVGIDSTGRVLAVGAGVTACGISLMGAGAAGVSIDVLITADN